MKKIFFSIFETTTTSLPGHVLDFYHKVLLQTEKGFKYLSTEFSTQDALNLAKTIIFDEHRNIAEKNCTKVFDCATNIQFNFVYFVHVPIWEVEYEYKNQTYRIAVLGNSGQILIGEIPVTKRLRIFSSVMTFLAFTGGIVVGFLLVVN